MYERLRALRSLVSAQHYAMDELKLGSAVGIVEIDFEVIVLAEGPLFDMGLQRLASGGGPDLLPSGEGAPDKKGEGEGDEVGQVCRLQAAALVRGGKVG